MDVRLLQSSCEHAQLRRICGILQRRRARGHSSHLRHRITVTYNLYWTESAETEAKGAGTHPHGVNVLQPKSANATDVSRVLSEVLQDKTLLPEGGTLGFGLRHAYPFPRTWDPQVDKKDPLKTLPALLKGSDRALYEACSALGLSPELKFVSDQTDEDDKPLLLDGAIQLCDTEVSDPMGLVLDENMGVIMEEVGADFAPSKAQPDEDEDEGPTHPVHWVTELGAMNKLASTFIHYGNQGVLSHFYMTACLTVDVGPVGDRYSALSK